MKLYTNKLKIGLCTSFLTGSFLFMLPNKISVKVNEKKFNRIDLPLLGGCLGVLGFLSSPFLIINYFCDGTYFDKLYDKYNIDIKRYYQYDGNNNKYAYSSNIKIEINNKEINNKEINKKK